MTNPMREALEKAAKYLDDLGDNLLRNDADMQLDECRDPKDVADELRQALSTPDGGGEVNAWIDELADRLDAVRSKVAVVGTTHLGGELVSYPRVVELAAKQLRRLAALSPTVGGGERAFTDADGVEWFERTFGVPIGDLPGRLDVERIKDTLLELCPPPPVEGE